MSSGTVCSVWMTSAAGKYSSRWRGERNSDALEGVATMWGIWVVGVNAVVASRRECQPRRRKIPFRAVSVHRVAKGGKGVGKVAGVCRLYVWEAGKALCGVCGMRV